MPVYEFYCRDCHTIFNFLSRRVDIDKTPACPRCGRPGLERQVSRFALSKGRNEEPADGMPDIDEERLGRVMESLAGEIESVDDDDPRQMARFMRKFTEATGMDLGDGMEEAIRRLEAGEDPDRIEAEMEGILEGDGPFGRQGIKGLKRRLTPPAHDDTLYPL